MRKKNSYLLCLLLPVFSGCMFTHIHKIKTQGIAAHAGLHGVNHSAIEIGVGSFTYGYYDLPHMGWWASRSYALTSRIELGDTTMYAFEASLWGEGLFGMGINAGYYTNFSANSCFYIRPEIGTGEIPIGFLYIHGAIGWNIRLLNHNAPEFNSPNLRVRLTIPFDTTTES